MNKKLIYIFLILLVIAISFSPRLSLGLISGRRTIDIRAEDIVLGLGLLGCLGYMFMSKRYQFKVPVLFWPIMAWLGFGFFSILVNLLLGNTTPELSFFYFLKEIEFFLLYLLVFSLVAKINAVKPLLVVWGGCMLANIGWLVYVFLFNVGWSTYYGPETFMEPQGPFPSGGFFLMLFVFFFNIFIFYWRRLPMSPIRKFVLFVVCVLPAAGVISSGSRTAVIGLFAALAFSFILYCIERVSVIRLIKAVALSLLLIFIFLQVITIAGQASRVLFNSRFIWEYTSSSSDARLGILKNNLLLVVDNIPNMIIGYGIKGEQHSQYMRVILERGFIGFLLFGLLIFLILRISYKNFRDDKDNFKKSLSAGLLAATLVMLVMAVPNDVFMVVKVDEVYWFFAAMTMAVIYNAKKNIQIHA